MKYFQLRNGQTLMIRKAKIEDASRIIDYINKVCKETENLTFGEGEFGITADKEAEFIEAVSKSENQLMICAYIEEKLVGQLVFAGGHRPRIMHTGEFSITVLKEYWGLEIGTEFIKYLINWAKETRIIRKINLKVRSDNNRAVKLYKSLNFVFEGTISREFFINGKFYDSIHMGIEID
ncbi:GNAT family N-acetyltransferase [Desulfitobacterium metallireducens]|uniref:Acetyltransferase n=1 Tax=Desulfitobacterium metallireducens DSM 15288 TaxID=871968 RepID=W0EDW7_9FIRM|nr:GNAT family protein [Desulfitobacterium metallireducens]AHF07394.1 acetyltransferase [Desulfitobacterium metallireducens DSM 15288]